jgi:hypothetical protein
VFGLVVSSLTWVVLNSANLPYAIYIQTVCVVLIPVCLVSLILNLRSQCAFALLLGSNGEIAIRRGRSMEVHKKNNSDDAFFEGGFVVCGAPVFWLFLIAMELKSSEGKVVHLLIVRDSMSSSAFHQLKVALVCLSVQQYRRKKSHVLNEIGNF